MEQTHRHHHRTLRFLKRNLKINSTTLKSTAYKTLIRPSLEYACTVWDPYTQGNIYKLEMVQRRAARFVLSGRYNNTSSVRDMLYELGWNSLQTRRQTLKLRMMYKIHKGLIAMDAQEFMTPLQRRRITARKFKCVQNSPLRDGLPHVLVFPDNDTRVEQPGQ